LGTTNGSLRRQPATRAGQKRWSGAQFQKLTHLRYAGKGIQALFPGTNASVIDADVLVEGLMTQAREDGLELSKFIELALKYVKPWPKPAVDVGALKARMRDLREALKGRSEQAVLLYLCVLLLLHRQHEVRDTITRAVHEGDHVSLRKAMKALMYGGSAATADREEFIEGVP
jgi:hypothetical protein